MSRTHPISVDCGANAVVDADFVEADGSGAVKAFDGTGSPIGIASQDKDAQNKVALIRRGLESVGTVNAAYKIGDALEANSSQKLVALTTGTQVATAMESKTTTTADNKLLVDLHM